MKLSLLLILLVNWTRIWSEHVMYQFWPIPRWSGSIPVDDVKLSSLSNASCRLINTASLSGLRWLHCYYRCIELWWTFFCILFGGFNAMAMKLWEELQLSFSNNTKLSDIFPWYLFGIITISIKVDTRNSSKKYQQNFTLGVINWGIAKW